MLVETLEATETTTSPNWKDLALKSMSGNRLDVHESLSILQSTDDDILSLLDSAFTIRKRYFGKKVKLNMLINATCGHCPEDCGYCSQSIVSKAKIEKHTLVDKDSINPFFFSIALNTIFKSG